MNLELGVITRIPHFTQTEFRMKPLIFAFTLLTAFNAQAKTFEIHMVNMGKEGAMAFEPSFVKVAPGDSVKFVPKDAAHNSQSFLVPKGAKAWTGKTDEAITVKLDKDGVYLFKCLPHSTMGMIGAVQVGKPSNLAEATQEAEKLAATFVMNKDRVKKIIGQIK